MTKFGTTIWIILSIVLISFPIGIILFNVIRKSNKLGKVLKQKINNVKTLDKMRSDLLKQSARETQEENNIKEDIVISKIFDENTKTESDEKIDINDSDTEVKNIGNNNIQEKQRKLLEKIFYESNVYKKDGKLEEYEKKLIEGLAIEPDNLELNKQLSDLYFTIGNHKKALSLLKKIIEKDPEDHNAIRQIGEIYLITGDYETAELLIEKAINLKPNNPKYYTSMVEIMYNTNRKKEAIAVMEKIVKLRPTNSSYIITLAELYEEIEDNDNAKKYYFRVLEQESNNEKAKRKIQELSSSSMSIE